MLSQRTQLVNYAKVFSLYDDSTIFQIIFPGAIVCVTLLNRLNGDQIKTPTEVLKSWEERPMQVVIDYMMKATAVKK